MSLHPQPLPAVPDETARIARAVYRKGNIYLTLRDELGPIFDDHDFLSIYGNPGAPATSPALLSLVSIMQYMEHLTDEQAADAVRGRVDWKYMLGLTLDDAGFDATVLVDFRARLVRTGSEAVLLDRLLARLREIGLLRAGGRQRTDSTHVLAAIRVLNRLELVAETMRHVLDRLAVIAPEWLRTIDDPAWMERYGRRFAGSRLPRKQTEREALIRQIGRDGAALLAAVAAPTTPEAVTSDAAIDLLRQVWAQQYEDTDDGPRFRHTDRMAAGEVIRSPYDPDARWAMKRELEWTGSKLQVTETCEPLLPRLVTDVETTAAPVTDEQTVRGIQQRLAERELVPDVQLVDTGYVTGPELVRSAAEHGITLLGPTRANTSWQAMAGEGYSADAFAINWAAEEAMCPAGKRSSSWRPTRSRTGQELIQIHFRQADCLSCPVRVQCTKGDRRSIAVLPQAQHEALLRRRQEQMTEVFRTAYAKRAGIEGTFTQADRRCGVRRARYRGLAKTHLQHILTAAAIDCIRTAAWLTQQPIRSTRITPYARFVEALAA